MTTPASPRPLRWYLPSFHGDFRLVAAAAPDRCELVLVKPTPAERLLLNAFLVTARAKGWAPAELQDVGLEDRTIALTGPLAKVGKALVKHARPAERTLTAVTFRDGRVEVAEGSQSAALDKLAAKLDPPAAVPARGPFRDAAPPANAGTAAGPEAATSSPDAAAAAAAPAEAAATVKRPTLSCPACEPGAVGPATEVLLDFLTPEQHEDWARDRALVVTGGRTGHRYLLAHRHTTRAARQGRICMDLDDRVVLHFHDWSVPPEEEVLEAKLLLEHREAWLRNEATMLGANSGGKRYFKNPFGDISDGADDAQFVQGVGRALVLADAVFDPDPNFSAAALGVFLNTPVATNPTAVTVLRRRRRRWLRYANRQTPD